jgi:serine protease Do
MSFVSKLRKDKLLSISLLALTLSIGIVIGTLINTAVSASGTQTVAPDATPLKLPPIQHVENEFSRLAKQLEPSVVFITTDYTPKQTSSKNDPDDEGIPEMFRRFFPQSPDDGPRRQYRREGSGSGFIVDRNGYILTNYHVVDQADHIKVKLTGTKDEYPAKVVGYDVESDVAVVKIDDGNNLKPVTIGNSDGVDVGDWAVAIGAPFGLEASVTAGIVSATGRDIAGAQAFQRFIQTDAAINPGNSGGPLVNIRGEVIGINTMIATSSGGYQGIGFALPVNMAVKVYNQIIAHGRVVRGSIGISFNKELAPEVMKALGMKGGVIVESVTPGGPAERAGLKPEDFLIALNGSQIHDGDDLVDRIADMPVGSEAKVTLDRGGQRMEKTVTIEDREKVFKDDPRFAQLRPKMESGEEQASTTQFGISIRALNDSERKQMKFDHPGGVLVTYVEEGSFAEDIGIRDKDVIVSINRQPIATFDDVKAIQSKLKPGDAVAFRVMRASPIAQRTGGADWVGIWLGGTIPATK